MGEIMRDPVLGSLAVLILVSAASCFREATSMRGQVMPTYPGSAREQSDLEREVDPPDDELTAEGRGHKHRAWIAGTLFFAALGSLVVIASQR